MKTAEEYFYDLKFEDNDYTVTPLPFGEYEKCVFTNCNFSKVRLNDYKFVECEFTSCDMSMVKLANTSLRDVKFTECKMLGLKFEECHEFGLAVSFDKCILNDSSFYKTILKKTQIIGCRLINTDFSESDFTSSVFGKCDLAGAIFKSTNLEKADFRSSFNYTIDPEINRIKKAKFSIPNVIGLLNKYDIKIEM